jgi:predicted naringenin-chalcone synthase
MHPHSTGRAAPVLSVPEAVFPPRSLSQRALIEAIGAEYAPLLERYPGDADYRAGFAGPASRALRMCGSLAIEEHPMHLPLPEILRPRGAGERNRQAREAFDAYAPLAAKEAMAAAHVSPDDVGAVVVANSTIEAMPSLAHSVVTAAGLGRRTEAITLAGEGCNGGAAAILRAREYVLARGCPVLIVVGDYASPWYYPEPGRRGDLLRGSIVSSALFSDATAAAVMTPGPGPAAGFRILETVSACLPGTEDALGFEVRDDGRHFWLTNAPALVPGVLPAIQDLLAGLGWSPGDLDICALHSGGNSVITATQKGLGLTGHQVEPAWRSLLKGNLMSAAVFHALAVAAADPGLRPRHGGRGLLAGFGPGFAMSAAAFEYHHPAAGGLS